MDLVSTILKNFKKLSELKVFLTFLNYMLILDCYFNIRFNGNIFTGLEHLKKNVNIEIVIQTIFFVGFYATFLCSALNKFFSFICINIPSFIRENLTSYNFDLPHGYIDSELLKRWAILHKNKLAYLACINHEKEINESYELKEISLSIIVLLGISHYFLNGTITNELFILLSTGSGFLIFLMKISITPFISSIFFRAVAPEFRISPYER